MFFQTLSFHQPMRPILTHMCKHKHTCTNIYISVDKQLDSVQICIRSTHIYTHTLGRDKDTLSHTHTRAHTHTHTHTHLHARRHAHATLYTCNYWCVFLLFFFYPPSFSDTNTNINFRNKQRSNYQMARVCVETTERDVSQDCSSHPPLPLLLGLFFFFFFFVIDSFLEIIYQEPSVHNNHK